MKFKIQEVAPNIFLAVFDSRYDLSMTFIRMQEFYESPFFKGKVFSLEDFIDWYSQTYGNGSFTYASDWSAFNIPGSIVKQWMDKFGYKEGEYVCKSMNIRQKEIEFLSKVLRRIKRSKKKIEDIYIIGCSKGESYKESLDHELAHSFYSMFPEYKRWCCKQFSILSHTIEGRINLERIKDILLKLGYHSSVIKDEIQAYWSTGGDEDRDIAFNKLFVEHFKCFRRKMALKKEGQKNEKKNRRK